MNKFTPGPWEAQIHENNSPYITSRRKGDEIGHDCIATINPQLHSQMVANARLIAAAPEMLQVLKIIRDRRWMDKMHEDYAALIDVIAKAEGTS